MVVHDGHVRDQDSMGRKEIELVARGGRCVMVRG